LLNKSFPHFIQILLVSLILVFEVHNTNGAITKSISIFNFPVEAIYLINNPKTGDISWGQDYKEACKKMGDEFFWGTVPSKNENPACYTLPSYNMIIGADTWFCADGSISYYNVPHNFCNDFLSCPDKSWTLSSDKLTCYKEDLTCIPDPENASEEQLLAAIAYGESHWSNNYEEMAAIASATLRRKKAKGFKTINELVTEDKNFSYATSNKNNQRYYNVMCFVNSKGVDLASKAAQNALSGGFDYSNGACFWDGIDLKANGKLAYRYLRGFRFSQNEHNILSVTEPPLYKRKGSNGRYYGFTYISTAGHGKSIFWKLSNEFLAAGGTQCI